MKKGVLGQSESGVTAAILMIGSEVNKERRKGEPNDFPPAPLALSLVGDVYALYAVRVQVTPLRRVKRVHARGRARDDVDQSLARVFSYDTHEETHTMCAFPSDVLTFLPFCMYYT